MNLDDVKAAVEEAEERVNGDNFTVALTFERNGVVLHVAITEDLIRRCRKDRIWKSKEFLTALKNAEYGFD
jgi:hypothetical protein